ncbi:MAG TPA: flagellar assembly peptidoglycan hydrolase FlgJ, partial [Rhodocyclaceae bacterium]|nr:flagellar assembly peptidoglycan hydrolase FlgJ [Rhodocyclaceae bacterium]
FDQQLGQNLAGSGSLGLARVLERQLSGGLPETSAAGTSAPGTSLPVGAALPAQHLLPADVEGVLRQLQSSQGDSLRSSQGDSLRSQKNPANAALPVPAAVSAGTPATPRDFVAAVWPHALEASTTTGLPPHLLVAHAALESGWGKSEPRRADGSPSYNLFGVKAGKRWAGTTVDAATTEFENGQAQARVEKFRAYGSYQEAFQDYANLLAASPRFSSVVAANNGTDFANSLQQSGYATDPMYAAKLSRIIQGKTLRDALQG